jgi:3-oxoacyl-[acyl-carrier protein] reductase
MELGLSGRSAMVFGASRGLGRAIACALAQEGVNLFLVARSSKKLQLLADEIRREHGVHADWISIDTGTEGAVDKLLNIIDEQQWNIDILVNISGGPKVSSALETSAKDYLAYFDSMIGFFIDISRAVAKQMMDRGWGRILTITSSGVCQPIKDLAISNTLRASMVTWSKTLSSEVAKHGVTVNTIIPGRIHTERVEEIDLSRAKAKNCSLSRIVSDSHSLIPAGRYGTVEELSSTVLFLSGQSAGYITGSSIKVDGGLIAAI